MTGTYVLFLLLGANNDPVISDLLPEADPILQEDLATHVESILQESLSIPTGTICNEDQTVLEIRSIPLMPSDNILFLADIRQRHQTKEAEKGVRLANRTTSEHGKHHSPSVGSGASDGPVSERRLLARKIHDIVKAIDTDSEEKITGSSTGLNRQIRWTKTYSPSPALSLAGAQNDRKSGNSANAMEVAQNAANLVSLISHMNTNNR